MYLVISSGVLGDILEGDAARFMGVGAGAPGAPVGFAGAWAVPLACATKVLKEGGIFVGEVFGLRLKFCYRLRRT